MTDAPAPPASSPSAAHVPPFLPGSVAPPLVYRIASIRNVGDSNFNAKFAGRKYTIEPGKTMAVPYECVVLWMGNPEARNVNARMMDRQDEVRRLRAKYGAYEVEAKWEENRPRLEAYDAVTNERVYTVLDDEEGTGIAAQTTMNPALGPLSMDQMQQQMVQMKAQLDAYSRMVTDMQGATGQGGGLPEFAEEDENNVDGSGVPTSTAPVFDGGPLSGAQVVSQPAARPTPLPDPTAPATRADVPRGPKVGK